MRFRWLFLMMFSLVLISCDEYYDSSYPAPTLHPRYIFVNYNSSMLSIACYDNSYSAFDIESMNASWKIDNSANWLSFSPDHSEKYEQNSTVVIGAKDNSQSVQPRMAVAYIRQGDDMQDWTYEKAISVRQEGASPNLFIEGYDFYFSGEAQTGSIPINTNLKEIKVDFLQSEYDNWFNCSFDGSAIIVNLDSNVGGYRSSTVTVSFHSDEAGFRFEHNQDFQICQYPASFYVSSESITLPASASSVKITVDSEVPWTVSTTDTWIDLNPTSGQAGVSDLYISTSPNRSTMSRQGNVVLSISPEHQIYIYVYQEGIYLNSNNTYLTFDSKQNSSEVDISSNISWSVLSKPSWITVSPSEGSGDATLTIRAEENLSMDSRSGNIVIGQDGLDSVVNIGVFQASKYFNTSTYLLQFNDKADSKTIEIEAEGTWTASTTEDWISLSPTSHTDSGTLTVSVADNPLDTERNGTVTIEMNGRSLNIDVVQNGKYFIIDNEQYSFNSKGGTMNLSIASNELWTASIDGDAPWLSLSATSGEGDANIDIVAIDNATLNSRSAIVNFETQHHQNVRLVINQAGRYLNVSSQSLFFYAKGGDSESVSISTDAQYTITTDATWLTITQYTDSFKLTATRNTDSAPRFASVFITMTDLAVGSYQLEIPVSQLNEGGSFIRFGFDGDEENWLPRGDELNIHLTIRPFDGVVDWNGDSGNSNIGTYPYTGDKDLDSGESGAGNVGANPYDGENDNWDDNGNTGNIGKNPYPDDKDLNGDGSGNIGVEPYTGDKDLDSGDQIGVSLTITGYYTDNNWDRLRNAAVTIIKSGYGVDKNLDN